MNNKVMPTMRVVVRRNPDSLSWELYQYSTFSGTRVALTDSLDEVLPIYPLKDSRFFLAKRGGLDEQQGEEADSTTLFQLPNSRASERPMLCILGA